MTLSCFKDLPCSAFSSVTMSPTVQLVFGARLIFAPHVAEADCVSGCSFAFLATESVSCDFDGR